jgi:hypothetical protein
VTSISRSAAVLVAALALSCHSDEDGRETAPGASGDDGGKAECVDGQPCEEEYDPLLCVQGVLIGDLPEECPTIEADQLAAMADAMMESTLAVFADRTRWENGQLRAVKLCLREGLFEEAGIFTVEDGETIQWDGDVLECKWVDRANILVAQAPGALVRSDPTARHVSAACFDSYFAMNRVQIRDLLFSGNTELGAPPLPPDFRIDSVPEPADGWRVTEENKRWLWSQVAKDHVLQHCLFYSQYTSSQFWDIAASFDPTLPPVVSALMGDAVNGVVRDEAEFLRRYEDLYTCYATGDTTPCVFESIGGLPNLVYSTVQGIKRDLQIRSLALDMVLFDHGLDFEHRLAASILVLFPSFGPTAQACNNGANGGTSVAECVTGVAGTSLEVFFTGVDVAQLSSGLRAVATAAGRMRVGNFALFNAGRGSFRSRFFLQLGDGAGVGEFLLIRAGQQDYWDDIARQIGDDVAGAFGQNTTRPIRIRVFERNSRTALSQVGSAADTVNPLTDDLADFVVGPADAEDVIDVVILPITGDGLTDVIPHSVLGYRPQLDTAAGLTDEARGIIYVTQLGREETLEHELRHAVQSLSGPAFDPAVSACWRRCTSSDDLWALWEFEAYSMSYLRLVGETDLFTRQAADALRRQAIAAYQEALTGPYAGYLDNVFPP